MWPTGFCLFWRNFHNWRRLSWHLIQHGNMWPPILCIWCVGIMSPCLFHQSHFLRASGWHFWKLGLAAREVAVVSCWMSDCPERTHNCPGLRGFGLPHTNAWLVHKWCLGGWQVGAVSLTVTYNAVWGLVTAWPGVTWMIPKGFGTWIVFY